MVRLASKADIGKIVDLHCEVLFWSQNMQLGRQHIHKLYEALFEGEDFFVVVMDAPGQNGLLGFASATTRMKDARRRLSSSVGWRERLLLVRGAILKPGKLVDLVESVFIIPFLLRRSTTEAELLTWVAKRNTPAGALAGVRCFNGVLKHFRSLGFSQCVAQVLRSNEPPNRFHAARGTRRLRTLLHNTIYVIDCDNT